jgi:hypothetical protein
MAYVFDPEKLHEIAKGVVGLEREEMVRVLVEKLNRAFPGHVDPDMDWIFNIAGGITGIMKILHGSLSEYLLVFGTPAGTDGFSGRYHLDIWDVVLEGEMRTYEEDSPLQCNVYGPGDLALLRRGRVKGVTFSRDNWMLEYGRGLIPTSLPFALITCHDPGIIARTVWMYGRHTVKELLRGKI